MPRGLSFDMTLQSAEAVEDLERIAKRMVHLGPVFEGPVMRTLESGEARHFAGLRGRYVQTGATRDALTQPNANGAIREAHNDELIFGVGDPIYYAKYLRKGKKSAVLVLKPKERKTASATIMDFIVGHR